MSQNRIGNRRAEALVDLLDIPDSYYELAADKYAAVDRDWPRSNPRGLGKWFEQRMRRQAELRLKALLERRVYASIDDVPTWEWKTPLQRAIQILKRHRDVMFKDNCDVAPISMIITTLAAQAYEGESNLYDTLVNILDRMPEHVRDAAPRIPNPVNPAEDFADRWKNDARLEPNFWAWHLKAKTDIAALSHPLTKAKLKERAGDAVFAFAEQVPDLGHALEPAEEQVVMQNAIGVITSVALPASSRAKVNQPGGRSAR